MFALVAWSVGAAEPEPPAPIPIDRAWEVLAAPTDLEGGARAVVASAADRLGDWTISVGGIDIDGPWLGRLAAAAPGEPFLRVVREQSGRAVDLGDFLLFLDDVLVAGEEGRRGEPFFLGTGRARDAGILVHPEDVFGRVEPHVYATDADELNVDQPKPQRTYPPAADGDPLGPEWTARYQNPTDRAAHYAALADARPDSGFASRVASLLDQIEQQGTETLIPSTFIASTVRSKERGYLMWGAFELSRATTEAEVGRIASRLDRRNREWELDTPITWRHPDGWEETIEAARHMADTYDVVYASEGGARWSKHYTGVAADFVAFGLPRSLTLHAPDGAVYAFDLSDPAHTRDLSLSPELVVWIEAHFRFDKLTSDYPHWSDAD